MAFVQNFPFFSIILSLFSGSVSSVLKGRAARILNQAVILTVAALSAATFLFTWQTGESFVYMMGHFPAPFGNEIRAGVLESATAFFFCMIMLLSLIHI